MKYYQSRLQALEAQLQELEKEEKQIFSICHLGIKACQDALEEFRTHILKMDFSSPEIEIGFFKTIKPKIMAHIVFYINRNQIESKTLFEGTKMHRKFLLGRLMELEEYFKENAEFYDYCLQGLSHRDTEFFTRHQSSYKLHYDGLAAIVDTQFSTSYDTVLAKIIGYNRTIAFLQQKLRQENPLPIESKEDPQTATLKWTGTKIDLVELVYALHSSGLVNNGQAGINELAHHLENMFAIKLGDIYRSFVEIRTRKNAPTRLLNTLKTSLINKIVEADG